MKKCIKCGKEIDDNFKVCPYCGKKQKEEVNSPFYSNACIGSSIASFVFSVIAFCLYFFFKVGIGLILAIPSAIVALISCVITYKNKPLLISNITIFALNVILLITYFMF